MKVMKVFVGTVTKIANKYVFTYVFRIESLFDLRT